MDIFTCDYCDSDKVAQYRQPVPQKQVDHKFTPMKVHAAKLQQRIIPALHVYPPPMRLECLDCGFTVEFLDGVPKLDDAPYDIVHTPRRRGDSAALDLLMKEKQQRECK